MKKRKRVTHIDLYSFRDETSPRGPYIGLSITRSAPTPSGMRSRHYNYYPPEHPDNRKHGEKQEAFPRQISRASMIRLNNALNKLYAQDKLLGLTWFSQSDDTLNGIIRVIQPD